MACRRTRRCQARTCRARFSGVSSRGLMVALGVLFKFRQRTLPDKETRRQGDRGDKAISTYRHATDRVILLLVSLSPCLLVPLSALGRSGMNTFVANPEWGVWIIAYFFRGGIAAGSYLSAILIEWFGRAEDHEFARIAYRIALSAGAVLHALSHPRFEPAGAVWHMMLKSEVTKERRRGVSVRRLGAGGPRFGV